MNNLNAICNNDYITSKKLNDFIFTSYWYFKTKYLGQDDEIGRHDFYQE